MYSRREEIYLVKNKANESTPENEIHFAYDRKNSSMLETE